MSTMTVWLFRLMQCQRVISYTNALSAPNHVIGKMDSRGTILKLYTGHCGRELSFHSARPFGHNGISKSVKDQTFHLAPEGEQLQTRLDIEETTAIKMYGQVHVCVKELVEQKFGAETWAKILSKAELDEHDDFKVFHRYDDTVTFKLIGIVCEVLDLELPVVLEVFGDYFLQYCLRHGYDKMLKTLGGDFVSFIQNLDSLHSLLALTYKNIEAPSFRCNTKNERDLELHYYTVRPGLYPIVLGLVKAVARDLYNQNADIVVVNKTQNSIADGKTQEHVTFRVTLKELEENTNKAIKEFNPSFPNGFHLSSEHFCHAFPYHIVFDSKLCIRQCGLMIQRFMASASNGRKITDMFELIHPRMEMTVVNIKTFINAVFMLKMKTSRVRKNGEPIYLILKGQMMWLNDINHMIFISSPRLSSLTELLEMNVFLADIPIYDVTRELVLLNQQRIAEIDIAKKLDETTIELRKISKALELEKEKTDMLLYQMLPEKVANDLKNGRQVEAEKFDQVTILFSDIVTFTNIAAACSAMDVVNMLNNLYHRFDARSTEHGVYKVETIGDAYMIVGGIPVKTTTHARPVASFALDMIFEANEVKSPATGKPLQIRVGVHTGPVVAGVVGKKMPRYCLFGDTVNTASRMESHGVPGRIHVSPTTYRHLCEYEDFIFRSRGEIEVKGKGKMATFFLIGSKSKFVKEPQDDCLDYPIVERSAATKISGQSTATSDRSLNDQTPGKDGIRQKNISRHSLGAHSNNTDSKALKIKVKSSACVML